MSGAQVPESNIYALLHGYLGHIEFVPINVGRLLVEESGNQIDISAIDSLLAKKLIDQGYLTDKSHEEERNIVIGISRQLRMASLRNSPTSFMIVPTITCNLRCPYCFQSHEMHKGKGEYGNTITEEQLDIIFRAIDMYQSPGAIFHEINESPNDLPNGSIKQDRITLFGGEPLCSTTLEIIPKIIQRCKERGISLSAITNGVELDLFNNMLGSGQIDNLQITLDGIMERHDRRRVGPNFKKTFERIVRNTEDALKMGVSISLRINVDQENIGSIEELHEYFSTIGWYEYENFSPYAAAVDSLGPQKARKQVSHYDVYQATQSVRNENRNHIASYESYAENLVAKIMLQPDEYPFVRGSTCSAETGQMIFDPLGDVYACWEDVGDKQHRIATFDKNGVHFDANVVNAWMHRFPGTIEQCSDCPFALVHTSGCAAHARSESDTIFSSACEGFQEYFPISFADAVRRFADGFQRVEAQQQEQATRTSALSDVRA